MPPAAAVIERPPPRRVSQYTSIGVLIRQRFCCRACGDRIGLKSSFFERVIPIDDPLWERLRRPLTDRQSPLRAYCGVCSPAGSRTRSNRLAQPRN